MGHHEGVITINSPLVVSETRDGDAIIMHHGTGTFFDSDGPGAFIWQMVEQSATLSVIIAALQVHYRIDAVTAERSAAEFLDELLSHDLVTLGSDCANENNLFDGATFAAAEPFAPPVLRVHSDLADMLLLDPIHDVDSAGWPIAAV